ncbi:predicted protein [Postia placenta Mad-698-R]|nr:predicted protein [Postia placenta Mad-698-R]
MYAFDVVFLITASVSTLVAALRVHAVSGRNWRWVLPVWLLGMVPVGINIDRDRPSRIRRRLGHTCDLRNMVLHWSYKLCKITIDDDGTYFMYSIISLLNTVDLTMNAINNTRFHSSTIDITILITAMSSILISRFLICIREAAERTTQEFSSPSFVDSQGKSSPQAWLSSAEFAADIDNPSAGDSNADAFSDLDDDLNSRGEDDAGEVESNEIEFEEYAASASSIDARSS